MQRNAVAGWSIIFTTHPIRFPRAVDGQKKNRRDLSDHASTVNGYRITQPEVHRCCPEKIAGYARPCNYAS